MRNKRQALVGWLENLQRDTWNMELLVSGFAIFLLLEANAGLTWIKTKTLLDYYFPVPYSTVLNTFWGVLQIAIQVITFHLIINVVLRAFWIGAVGLRSVQPTIHFPSLGYSPYFSKKLTRKVKGLEHLSLRLDNLCSTIFAFTFLLVFMLLSLFLAVLFTIAINLLFLQLSIWMGYTTRLAPALLFLFLLISAGALLYAFDTISMGLIKRIKWVSRVYYPWYVFMGYVTLAFLYRSIYYALLSRFKGIKRRLVLLSYIGLILILPFVKFEQSVFFPDNESRVNFKTHYYDDLRDPSTPIYLASIPHQIVKNRFLPLFIRYDVKYNSAIRQWCSGYEPSKKEGLISGIQFWRTPRIDRPFVKEKDPQKLLACLSTFYNIYLDGQQQQQPEFWYYTQPGAFAEKGINTVLDLSRLLPGKHVLSVRRKSINVTPEIKEEEFATIPFWLE